MRIPEELTFTMQKISKCGFYLTRIFQYTDRVEDSSLFGKIRARENPYFGIFFAVTANQIPYF